MQCPPTKPGVYFTKFHLLHAALITSDVFILRFSQIFENSLINAILISRCVFYKDFAASAISIDLTLYNLLVINL